MWSECTPTINKPVLLKQFLPRLENVQYIEQAQGNQVEGIPKLARRGPTAGICHRCIPNPVINAGGGSAGQLGSPSGFLNIHVNNVQAQVSVWGNAVESNASVRGLVWQDKLVRTSFNCLSGQMGSPIPLNGALLQVGPPGFCFCKTSNMFRTTAQIEPHGIEIQSVPREKVIIFDVNPTNPYLP